MAEPFFYRKTSALENSDYELKCSVMKPNQMQCDRRVTTFLNEVPFCEGHFMSQFQVAQNNKDDYQITDLTDYSLKEN